MGMVAAVIAMGMAAQPDGPADAEPPPPDRTGLRDITPERARHRLSRMRDRIDEAIAALDEGQPTHEVLRGVLQDHERMSRMGEPRRVTAREPSGELEPLSEEDAAALVKEHLPDLHARLTGSDAALPGLRSVAMQRIANRVRGVLGETEEDPELRVLKLAELRAGADVFDAVRRYREASQAGEDARATARDELVAVIGAQFDARQAVAQAELDRLEQRVERMRADIVRMDARRAEEIDRMLDRVERSPERRQGERRRRGGS